MMTPEERRKAIKRNRIARELGLPRTTVDAGPAREYLCYLKSAGAAYASMCEESGIGRNTLVSIARGRRQRIFREREARILALRPPVEPSRLHIEGLRMPIHGSQRRLQALTAEGFGRDWMAHGLDMQPNNVTNLLQGKGAYILSPNAERIKALYEKYAGTDPLDLGMSEYAVNRARMRAARHGYAASIYWDWDVLDDPGGFPDWTGECGTTRGAYLHKKHGTPYCDPCRVAYNAQQSVWLARYRAGLPTERKAPERARESRWSDPILVARLRADFESYTDVSVMEEKYGAQIAELRRYALRDGWTHAHAQPDANWAPKRRDRMIES